jgi:hypothetical protein
MSILAVTGAAVAILLLALVAAAPLLEDAVVRPRRRTLPKDAVGTLPRTRVETPEPAAGAEGSLKVRTITVPHPRTAVARTVTVPAQRRMTHLS